MDSNLKQLHERDFNLWIEEIKIRIQNRDLNGMDWDNFVKLDLIMQDNYYG